MIKLSNWNVMCEILYTCTDLAQTDHKTRLPCWDPHRNYRWRIHPHHAPYTIQPHVQYHRDNEAGRVPAAWFAVQFCGLGHHGARKSTRWGYIVTQFFLIPHRTTDSVLFHSVVNNSHFKIVFTLWLEKNHGKIAGVGRSQDPPEAYPAVQPSSTWKPSDNPSRVQSVYCKNVWTSLAHISLPVPLDYRRG